MRRGRTLLFALLALYLGVSYALSAAVSPAAGGLWAAGFFLVLAVWGYRVRDRGFVVIGLVFAALNFLLGFLLPLLLG